MGGADLVDGEGSEARLLRYDGDRHLCTIAPSGSGKMTTCQSLVVLGQLDRSMVVIDPKGQLAAISARHRVEQGHNVVCLNPFKLHTGKPWGLPCHSFNPLAGIDPASPSFVADIERLASALVEVTGNDAHWGESARDVVSWLMMWVIEEGSDPTLNHVRDLLSKPDEEFCSLAKAVADPQTGSPFFPLRNKAGAVTDPNKTTAGVLSTARTQTRFLDDPQLRDNLKESGFEFAALKREPVTVYLILPADYIASHSKWLRVMVVSALSAFYRQPQGHKVLFMLDEFAQLGYMDDIRKGLGLIRDFGVQIWPFFQDWNQVKGIYKDFAESLIANCGVVQVFAPGDDVTAKWVTEKIGPFKDVRRSWSQSSGGQGGSSSSVSHSEHDRHYTVQELHSRILGGKGQLLFKEGMAARNFRFDYYAGEPWRGWAMSNPYHMPPAAPPEPPLPEPVGTAGAAEAWLAQHAGPPQSPAANSPAAPTAPEAPQAAPAAQAPAKAAAPPPPPAQPSLVGSWGAVNRTPHRP